MRNLTPALLVIKDFEGFDPNPYLCPAGIPTIGYGTTKYPDGRKVTLQDPPITKEYALECLEYHLQDDCERLESFLKKESITLNNNQFCALISFAYNCGIGPVITRGKMINEGLRTGNSDLVKKGLLAYTRATVNGKRIVLKGLERRRKVEAALYFS